MADINYEKAEKEVEKAVQNTTIKNLIEGKSVTSSRAMEFYALEDETSRPAPEDRVARLISETAAEEEEEEMTPKKKPLPHSEGAQEEGYAEEVEEGEDVEEEFEVILQIPQEDKLKKARKQSSRTPKKIPPHPRKVEPSEKFIEPASSLLILRKHILWLKRQHIDDRYERLGTTKEEVFALRRARRLTEKDLQRINELNERAEELKKELLKKSGKETPEEIIEKGRKRTKPKRFNTKDSWVPL